MFFCVKTKNEIIYKSLSVVGVIIGKNTTSDEQEYITSDRAILREIQKKPHKLHVRAYRPHLACELM